MATVNACGSPESMRSFVRSFVRSLYKRRGANHDHLTRAHQRHVGVQCIHAITTWASSEDLHQPWKSCKEHAPTEKAVGDAANSRRHVPDDADDDSDHGAAHSNKEAGFSTGKQDKRKRGAAAESSSADCRLPHSKKVSLSLSSVLADFHHNSTPAAAMAGTEGRSAHASRPGSQCCCLLSG